MFNLPTVRIQINYWCNSGKLQFELNFVRVTNGPRKTYWAKYPILCPQFRLIQKPIRSIRVLMTMFSRLQAPINSRILAECVLQKINYLPYDNYM